MSSVARATSEIAPTWRGTGDIDQNGVADVVWATTAEDGTLGLAAFSGRELLSLALPR